MSTAAPVVDPNDFEWVAAFLYKESGIVLTPEKSYLITTRLTPLLRRFDLPSMGILLGRLRSRTDAELTEAVVDAFTTNETSFFRDHHPFETLAADILPAIIEARKVKRRLRFWSAACSTGQEPYTLGMTVRSHFPELRSWNISILATDLSTDCLAVAKAGLYKKHEVHRGLDDRFVNRFFQLEGRNHHVLPDISNLVTFEQFNLVTQKRSDGPFDVIFLRNVLIYFDDEIREAILIRMHALLAPDGVLMLGGSEAASHMPEGLYETRRHDRTTWHVPAGAGR